MQYIIVHGKNNPYSDLYLIILMIALELCWWWLLIEHSSGLPTLEHATYNCPCEKQSVFRSIPHYYNDCPWALLMVIANWTFPVSRSSFICPPPPVPPGVPVVVVSLCPGRHLCPGVPVCNFSLSVPVVICVPVSRSVISSVDKHDVSRQTTSWRNNAQSLSWRQSTNMTSVDTQTWRQSTDKQLHDGIMLNPYNDVSRQTWRQSTHKHDVSQQTNNLFLHIYRLEISQSQTRDRSRIFFIWGGHNRLLG